MGKKIVKTGLTILLLSMIIASVAVIKVPEVEAQPTLKWRWSINTQWSGYDEVMTSPIVTPLYDDNSDNVVNEQDNLYIVFGCFEYTYTLDNTICVLDKTGTQVAAFNAPNPNGPNAVSAIGQIAVADITDALNTGNPDGRPDILAIRENGNGIICFDNEGNIQWTYTGAVSVGGAIAVADIDGDGLPEVIVSNISPASLKVLNSDGSLSWQSPDHSARGCPVVADLDTWGIVAPEVVTGNRAFRNDGATFWDLSATNARDGFVAVADILPESSAQYPPPIRPEVVVVWPGLSPYTPNWNGVVYLLDDVDTTAPYIKWHVDIPNGDAAFNAGKGNGGPPTIGDFDGDGDAEIGVACYTDYVVYDFDGTLIASFDTQDHSSGWCSSSAFDFDGDKRDEIVYRDENNLYIFGCNPPTVHWQIGCSSFTGSELPVIADMDKDCHAEIVVSADHSHHGSDWGIYVYENDDEWGRTRCIWNQHSYHITNIESDASVPPIENINWEYFNNYRCQPSTGMGNCLVAAGSQNNNVYVFDFDGNLLWSHNTGFPVVSVAMDNDAKFIAVGSRGGATGRLHLFTHEKTPYWFLNLWISTSYDDFSAGTESKSVDVKYNEHNGEVVVAAAAEDGLYLFHQNGVLIWCYPHRQTIVRISQDGNYIICADYNTGVACYFSHMHDGSPGWDSGDNVPEWTWGMPYHPPWVYWVAISREGENVALSTWYPDAIVLLRGWDGGAVWTRSVQKGGWKASGVRVDMACDWGSRVVSVNDDSTDLVGYELLCWDHTKNYQNGWQNGDRDWIWQYAPSTHIFDDFYSVSISGDGKIAAAGGVNPGIAATNYVFMCSVVPSAFAEIQRVSLGTTSIQSIDLTFPGKYGVAGDNGGRAWFFSKHSNTPLWNYPTGAAIHCVAISKSQPCFMEYPPKRSSSCIDLEMVSGCSEQSPGNYAVLGYKANWPLPAPTWEAVDAWTIPNVPGTRPRASPCFADLDDDGDYDLLISNSINVPPMGYKNIGNRTHPAWQRYTAWDVPSLGGYEQNPDLADLDNDGDYDLCIGTEFLGHMACFFENTGNASFPIWIRKADWDFIPGVEWPSPAFADLDNDGDYDLLFGAFTEGYCVAWENTGNVTIPIWTRKLEWDLTALPTNYHKKPDLADLDNDGDYDLMIGIGNPNPNASKIWAWENTGTPMNPQWNRNPMWDIPCPNMQWIRPAFANLDGVHDIAIHNHATSKTIIGQGYPLRINATAINQGDHLETFSVKVSANEKIIQTQAMTLARGNSLSVTFTWNTTGSAKGNYTISVTADTVLGEADTTDNTIINGIVIVTIPGDVNGDFRVNIKDATLIGLYWTQHVPPAPPNIDINDDYIINIKDATIVGLNWLKNP